MAIRTKVLVVDSDLDSLSRIYLALIHRNYKAEATDKGEEIAERIRRLKPSVIIFGMKEYAAFGRALKVPAILILDQPQDGMEWTDEIVPLQKPFSIDALIRLIESLVI